MLSSYDLFYKRTKEFLNFSNPSPMENPIDVFESWEDYKKKYGEGELIDMKNKNDDKEP